MRLSAALFTPAFFIFWGIHACLAQTAQYEASAFEETSELTAEYFTDLEHEKIDLNNANETEILQIPFLSPFQKAALWDYLQHHRPMQSIYELAYITGFTPTDAQTLATYSELLSVSVQKEKTTPFRHKIYYGGNQRIKLSAAQESPAFADFGATKQRIQYKADNREKYIGLQVEKDAGEHLATDHDFSKPEFLSMFCMMENPNGRFIAGDYDVRWGQGLIAWNGFGMSKGMMGTDSRKSAQGFAPHTSSEENLFERGAAYEMKAGNWRIGSFISADKKDGEMENGRPKLQESGLHVTETEMRQKDNLNYSATGARIGYKTNDYEINSQVVARRFSETDTNAFTLGNASIDITRAIGNSALFSEVAIDHEQKHALLAGMQLRPSPGVECSAVFRDYATGYQSFGSSSMAEYSGLQNERGMYCAGNVYAFSNLKLSGYYDLFINKSERFGYAYSGNGQEWAIGTDYSLPSGIRIWGKFSAQDKPLDTNAETQKASHDTKRKTVYFKIRQSDEQFTFTAGGYFSKYSDSEKSSKGDLLFCGFSTRLGKWTKLDCQLVNFNTTFDSRIYLYEPYLAGGMSIPAYFGNGNRAVFRIRIKHEKLELGVKYGYSKYRTGYSDKPENIDSHEFAWSASYRIN